MMARARIVIPWKPHKNRFWYGNVSSTGTSLPTMRVVIKRRLFQQMLIRKVNSPSVTTLIETRTYIYIRSSGVFLRRSKCRLEGYCRTHHLLMCVRQSTIPHYKNRKRSHLDFYQLKGTNIELSQFSYTLCQSDNTLYKVATKIFKNCGDYEALPYPPTN